MGQSEGHHVGQGQEGVQLVHGAHLIKALDGAVHRPLQADGLRAQALAQPGEVSPHVSRPQHQHGAAQNGLHGALVLPDVGPLAVQIGGQTAADGHQAGEHVLGHAAAVGPAGGGEQDALREEAGVLLGARPHGLEPLQAGGPLHHLRPGPAEHHSGGGNLLRGDGAAPGVGMDGVGGDGFKFLPLPLVQGEEI